MKTIYILLTKTRTVLSRAIHATTGDGYTHIALALDSSLTELYSFARKNPWTPLPAGLVKENVHEGVYGRNENAPCLLYRLSVTEAQHEAIRLRIAEMEASEEPYRYSVLGILLCRLDLAHTRCHHMFCSQFVATLLEEAGALQLPKPSSLMRPSDFIGIPGLQRCYEGTLAHSDAWWQLQYETNTCIKRLNHVY